MKRIFTLVAFLGFASGSYAQLSDQEYSYVTMDLQGILNLTMTTDPNIGFSFKSIADYKQGIVKYNATKLEVDATVAWDLFAYASTANWIQTEAYSTNGTAALPAEILQIQSATTNTSAATNNFNAFARLKGVTNSGVVAGVPTVATQFLAGMKGTSTNQSYIPGSAAANPATNQFRLHYKLVPGLPAKFGVLTGTSFAQAGYYYLEVVYALVEDL